MIKFFRVYRPDTHPGLYGTNWCGWAVGETEAEAVKNWKNFWSSDRDGVDQLWDGTITLSQNERNFLLEKKAWYQFRYEDKEVKLNPFSKSELFKAYEVTDRTHYGLARRNLYTGEVRYYLYPRESGMFYEIKKDQISEN